MTKMESKVALVTGASRGIGAAITQKLAKLGYICILVSRKIESLSKVEDKIIKDGGKAISIAANMGKIDEVRSLAKTVEEKYGRLDVFINNAATNPYYGPLFEIDEARYDKTWDVNFKGPFFLSNYLAPLMVGRENPNIIHISSVNAFRPPVDQGVYSITKAALIALVKAQAKEFSQKGIRVNAIAPGLVETKFAKALVDSPQLKASFMDHTPSGRLGQPEDIAHAALFLVSEGASYTNGTCLTVDGGYLS